MSQAEEIRKPTFAAIQEEIVNMLDVPDEELTEDQRQAMDEYLNELANMESAKVDGFAQFIRLQTAALDACKEEQAFLRKKAQTMEKRIKHLKEHYVAIMRHHDLKKIKGNMYSISLRRNESVNAPEDQGILETLFREEPLYVKEQTTYSVDKGAVKEAIKAGIKIPGCSIEENFSLMIR